MLCHQGFKNTLDRDGAHAGIDFGATLVSGFRIGGAQHANGSTIRAIASGIRGTVQAHSRLP